MMYKTKHLLLFTIGPVKSFIQESRKAQDLFASSALLSHLCKDAILKAYTAFKNDSFELITPAIKKSVLENNTNPSIPNRFFASIETEEPTIISERLEKIKDDLITSFSVVSSNENSIELPKGAEEQLKNHLEIRWVITKYHGDTYKKEDFYCINKNLAAIKNYTPIYNIKELGRKCIVDGKHNVKFYRMKKTEQETTVLKKKLYQPKTDVKVIEHSQNNFLAIWQLQKGEGISAVTLKKRLYQTKPHQFPSTASIALSHSIHCLENHEDNNRKHAFIKFKDKVQDNGNREKYLDHSNDQLFYKDNIESIFLEESKTKEDIKKCITEHEAWSKNVALPTYYALLRFDGDNLGDWFTGDFRKKEISLKDYHTKLSQCLICFADMIKSQITAPKGSVIYAGGEDFMAMINIHYLKEVIDLIKDSFKDKVSDKMQEYINYEKPFTLSMGICIAHYKEPLQLILNKTSAMEKLAKDNGRDRFSIQVSKHSGGQISCSLKWETLAVIENIIDARNNKHISRAFILNIYNACETLAFSNEAKELLKIQTKVFVSRAMHPDKDNTQVRDKIIKDLQVLFETTTVNTVANALLITDFIQAHD